jgi:UDP:flavonoid glycosyltransferase YjiC (YdhE family)
MTHPRFLFYAVNGLGLGHVTRLVAIARELRKLIPGAEIVFLTSSEAEDVLYREGFAAIKVPSKTMRIEGSLRPGSYARLLHTVTLNAVAALRPHVLVVDTFPAGAIQELLPVLRWDSRKVFVFRAQRAESASSERMQSVLPLYDLCLVPHEKGTETVPVPEGLRTVWTGPILIRTRDEARTRAEARAGLSLPEEGPVLYVSFGGGGDAEARRAYDAVMQGLEGLPVHLALAEAPLLRSRGLAREGVTWVRHYPMAEMLPAFDGAIAAAGYNTVHELLHHGVPAAFHPFERQVDDQEARSETVERSRAGVRLPNLDSATLRAAVERLMDPDSAERMRNAGRELVPSSGAARAAEEIVRLLV